MTIIDLTHPLHAGMPIYPGTEEPAFSPANTLETDGFRETLLHMTSHTGTHMDAPAHIIPGGKTLDQFDAGQFIGTAVVIDCTAIAPGGVIPLELVLAHPRASEAEFLLFHTGWDRLWGSPDYFANYPCVAPEVVDYVLSTGKKGVGLDTISLDPMACLTLHRRLLGQNKTVILENLTRLDQLSDGLFTLCALPLPYEKADGSPLRAVALLEA